MEGIVNKNHIDRSRKNFGYEGMQKDLRKEVLHVPHQVEGLPPGRFDLDD